MGDMEPPPSERGGVTLPPCDKRGGPDASGAAHICLIEPSHSVSFTDCATCAWPFREGDASPTKPF